MLQIIFAHICLRKYRWYSEVRSDNSNLLTGRRMCGPLTQTDPCVEVTEGTRLHVQLAASLGISNNDLWIMVKFVKETPPGLGSRATAGISLTARPAVVLRPRTLAHTHTHTNKLNKYISIYKKKKLKQ